jgi:hypothetical protein
MGANTEPISNWTMNIINLMTVMISCFQDFVCEICDLWLSEIWRVKSSQYSILPPPPKTINDKRRELALSNLCALQPKHFFPFRTADAMELGARLDCRPAKRMIHTGRIQCLVARCTSTISNLHSTTKGDL